jgi:hypothetical protein
MGKFRFLGVQKKSPYASRGQATILIATLAGTFLLFLGFVVNTGLLVHAKINLQNAADLAAYSGAAVQARQLTHISYLNYEMRRQFKKFLFRYYVIGNMAQETHPESPVAGLRKWGPKIAGPDFGTPSVCLIFNTNDNYCQVAAIEALPEVQGGVDPVSQSLGASYNAIEATKKDTCKALGETNVRALILWLLNTDPEQEKLKADLAADPNIEAKALKRLTALTTLTQGMGLLPKNMLLKMRIKTLEEVMNDAPKSGLTLSAANSLKGADSGWFESERTLQAFYSAYHTLGNNLFKPDDIFMDEIAPAGPAASRYLKLEPQEASMDVYATDLGFRDAGGAANCSRNATDGARGAACVPCLRVFSFGNPDVGSARYPLTIPMGVQKDPSVLTYYAVRLTAKTSLLFSRMLKGLGSQGLELTAVSAAQPFGSRIGPYLPKAKPDGAGFFSSPYSVNSSDALGNMCSLGGGNIYLNGVRCIERAPNLPVKAGENLAAGGLGWQSRDVQYHYYGNVGTPNPGGGYSLPNPLRVDDLNRAYQIAMSPTQSEIGQYNIPNDLKNVAEEPFLAHFSDKGADSGRYSIWAPLVLTSKAGDAPEDVVRARMNEIRNIALAGNASAPESVKLVMREMMNALVTGLDYYVTSRLKFGTGEEGEGVNVYRFKDPTHLISPTGASTEITGLPPTIFEGKPENLRTSWGKVLSATARSAKRNTYSVKFVPFQLVTDGGSAGAITTNGTSSFTNKLPASTLGGDLDKLDH